MRSEFIIGSARDPRAYDGDSPSILLSPTTHDRGEASRSFDDDNQASNGGSPLHASSRALPGS